MIPDYNENTINASQDSYIRRFDQLVDPLDKIQLLIEIGRTLPAMREADRIDDNLIMGCQSKVWVYGYEFDGTMRYSADAEPTAQIARGLIAILLWTLAANEPMAIVEANLYFIQRIGLGSLISSKRSGGLASMIERMKEIARTYC